MAWTVSLNRPQEGLVWQRRNGPTPVVGGTEDGLGGKWVVVVEASESLPIASIFLCKIGNKAI